MRSHIRVMVCLAALSLPFFAAAAGTTLENPTSFKGISDFVAGFLRAITLIALPIIALFLVYAGFLFVKAQGEPGKLNDAKRNFMYVILGAGLILGAWVLATLIGGTVSQLVRG